MSIRTNPMKAVPLLLRHLRKVEHQANLEDLKSVLINIKDVFSLVKKNEEELLDTLVVVDGYIRKSNIRKLMEEKKDICERIMDSTQKLLPRGAIQSSNIEATQSSSKPFQDVNRASPSSQLQNSEEYKVNYQNLRHLCHKRGFLSLLSFPKNAITSKRNIITWWMGTGDIHGEEDGEDVFVELLHCNLIVPHRQGQCPHVNKFKVNPWVHDNILSQNDKNQPFGIYSRIISSHGNDTSYHSLVLDQREAKLGDELGFEANDLRSVFNMNTSYVKFGIQWMAKMKNLEVLHLGRWLQHSASHHIEVESEEFLKELTDHKYLKYISLRGISRIAELPTSIFQLESLETLDLKACHNLETLPKDISSLKKLKHLNLSQCYLLERMPRGIEKLTELQVLKGFVMDSSSPYEILDLVNLKKLEQLSIHIQDGDFRILRYLSALRHLKISWGVSTAVHTDVKISFPSNLEKLHLQGFPGQNFPEWLKPEKLPFSLKELNISGGKLNNMDHGKVYDKLLWLRILRLKYLKHLEVDLANLQRLFPSLWYVEIKHVLNHPHFEWRDHERS